MRAADNPVAFATKVLGIQVHPGQAAFLMNRHPVRVLIGGRRAGKSMSLAILIAWTAVIHAVAGKAMVTLAVAPTLDQAKLLLGSTIKLLRASPVGGLITKHIESPFPEVQLGNDVVIAVRSVADHGKHLRGHGNNVGLVVLDEAGFVQEEVFLEILAPLLADRAGSLVLASTPAGGIGSALHKVRSRRWTEG